MVSFYVESLFTDVFTNKPLDECIDLAVKYIAEGNPGLKLCTAELKDLFSFATAQTRIINYLIWMSKFTIAIIIIKLLCFARKLLRAFSSTSLVSPPHDTKLVS